MSDYVFEIGEDNFPKFNREYVSMNTSEGLRITIALVVSGIPFSGHFDKNRISFAYGNANGIHGSTYLYHSAYRSYQQKCV